jgi:hypothetical protein
VFKTKYSVWEITPLIPHLRRKATATLRSLVKIQGDDERLKERQVYSKDLFLH